MKKMEKKKKNARTDRINGKNWIMGYRQQQVEKACHVRNRWSFMTLPHSLPFTPAPSSSCPLFETLVNSVTADPSWTLRDY